MSGRNQAVGATEAHAPTTWLTPGVRGIGTASLLSDLGHEVPTALLPSFLTATLGAPASALGLIEGISDGLAGAARLAGGALADDPHRRRATAVGGYAATAVLSGLIGVATTAWQVGILRAGAWTARGLRVPARNALLADAVPAHAYGRAYGFERAMDNLGAVFGPLLALGLLALVGVRSAILISIIPGALAAVAVVYAIRAIPQETRRERQPIRLRVRPVLRGDLGRLLVAVSAFEIGNVTATLLILRTSELLEPQHGTESSTRIAVALYVGYNVAATLASIPAGHVGDAFGKRRVFGLGVLLFLAAYLAFAVAGPSILLLGVAFVIAGIAIGCVETAEHAAVASFAPGELRGSAFGLLAAMQSVGNLAASAVAGLVWSLASPRAAFLYLAAWMIVALAGLAVAVSRRASR